MLKLIGEEIVRRVESLNILRGLRKFLYQFEKDYESWRKLRELEMKFCEGKRMVNLKEYL